MEALSTSEFTLCLYGLTELSDAVAEILSKHDGKIYLRSLTSLSDAAAKSLAKMDPENLDLNWELQKQFAKYRWVEKPVEL